MNRSANLFARLSVFTAILVTAGANMNAYGQTPTAELGFGMHRIEAEIAHTPQTRQTGLMFRQRLPAQRGMLFVFTEKAIHCMWMKNTLLPLSVAFLEDDGTVINIEDMQPQTENNHCAAAPARFALEMNQGWFAQRGVEPGSRIRGMQDLPAPY